MNRDKSWHEACQIEVEDSPLPARQNKLSVDLDRSPVPRCYEEPQPPPLPQLFESSSASQGIGTFVDLLPLHGRTKALLFMIPTLYRSMAGHFVMGLAADDLQIPGFLEVLLFKSRKRR